MSNGVRTMVQGIRADKCGGPEVLQHTQFELPLLDPGKALVKLYAAGVNFIDIYQRRGTYPVNFPWTPGLEGAGIVESVGEGVTDIKPGDRVAYTSVPGSYAQANIVPAEKLIPLPDDISFEQGAAFPLQGMTAHYLLHEFYRIKPGETVLIHAAAGGMGLLLVQWAKHLGARVIGTVSNERKLKLAKEAGADELIIYTEQDFVKESQRLTNEKGPELIIDGVGKDTFAKNLQAVASRGHVIIFGSASGPAEPVLPNSLQSRAITISGGSLFAFTNDRKEILARANAVIKGIKEGWLRLNIDSFPLKQAAKSHEMLENRLTTGKMILKCD